MRPERCKPPFTNAAGRWDYDLGDALSARVLMESPKTNPLLNSARARRPHTAAAAYHAQSLRRFHRL